MLRALLGRRAFGVVGILCLARIGAAGQGSAPVLPWSGPARRPLTFVENRGQWDGPARFLAHAGAGIVGLEPDALALLLVGRDGGEKASGAYVRLVFENSSPAVHLEGERRLAGSHHFLLGRDPSRWRTDVPGFAAVRYRGLLPGVDLRVREQEGRLEYDLLLAPGADPAEVLVRAEGVEGICLDGDTLVLETAVGEIRQPAPIAWLGSTEERGAPLECSWRLVDDRRFAFALRGLEPGGAAVIDPGLEWSTYLGGSSYEFSWAITGDPAGSVTVAGETAASNFPVTPGAYDTSYNGSPAPTADVTVSRFDAGTGSLLFSTYLGGSGGDKPFGILGDGAGGVIVVGNTASSNFPVTPGALDTSLGGPSDGFVARLDGAGSALLFSTFLGGASDGDIVQAAARDPSGAITVAGVTSSGDFPVTPGAFDTSLQGSSDAFVSRLDPSGSTLLYSTLLGGGSGDVAQALGLDATGAAIVSGVTSSSDFPVTPGAFDTSSQGSSDVFVTRLNAAGSALLYSTYLGGGNGDVAEDLAVDAAGVATVVGVTSSNDFPTTPGAFQTGGQGPSDAFVARLDASGSGLVFSTLLGGGGGDVGRGVRLAPSGAAVVTGDTSSSDFPTTPGAFDTTPQGSSDAFVSFVDPTGSALLYSTFLGGGGADGGHAVALLSSNALVASGVTNSSNFPTTPGALDSSLGGAGDGFVSRLGVALCGVSPYGASTPACSGAIEIGTNHCPVAGDSTFAFTASNAPPSTIGLLAIGLASSPAGTPVLGVTAYVSLAAPIFALGSATNASGEALRLVPIPGGTTGAHVFAQFVWVNTPSCPGSGSLSASGALDVTVQ
ncbi:MAG TPA: hypothetical protein VFI25_11615 [Planctomycetota bacterium]|jgi:hypothetical protein|nr:hypothetical protein [Planctomycetota bacterium]